ncbi:pyrroloquinoline quinone biosynthesis protein PqqB [Rhodobacter sphaeroides]|uniref:Coenzyme PQQ synthesis protein B n=1 Tax=Cereibacter sphaeroides (strain ATCC 17023 / DSM 158 / JCM 6121 / CCUG 31486 / LMG 2827 / NBRC 12203 / NCIMB 8253 / ATH 2.4.1.) TaxID=272943 RepID=Q3IZR4_CERS4|nr:pyrroloquinoline quinone biosynthesis protein PqqB [Cereibacter sphaeroides]ABA79970.1 pyrroloquinoline quinone biosynthesis protein PqqB [Cereibacter sphaeroides 2.4.1]AMJ48238.1 pyrroloquinoline quinone biosynthesis protein PqqB [Cereibacter sphaeroides]ANS34948.1 pyrroloquinoline quinone biosynthesis protein B [Cereibacter sphaeroides]ATN63998.1 pyrroloquinoline quinone biosynthesis protein B [Cereibacter sphaeroides]AXC62175.1 pyrroloquinoline quinone biosynthesis protein PqqB [Cereibac
MLRIIVLGSAAGGGLPQWNCNCAGCRAARAEPALRNGQCALAASADGESWFLVNASPDLRQQILDTPALHPRHGLRHSPIAGVILTNAEVDAVAGLLTLREGWPFAIHAHPDVLEVLAANPIFGVLRPEIVPRRPMRPETPFEPVLACGRASGLTVRSFAVPGKPALWREEEGAAEGDSIGLELSAGGRRAFILPGCAEVTPALADRLAGADLVFFDGTLWQDDEMIRAGLSQKTGRRMGHISMSGPAGAMAALDPLGISRKVFVHINNSNPVLMPGSPERAEAERAGWCVPAPGMEFVA